MIRPFYQAAKNVLRADSGDVLGLEAVRAYYRWLYWAQGHAALDAAILESAPFQIIPAIRDTARKLDFPFASIARAFRKIGRAAGRARGWKYGENSVGAGSLKKKKTKRM